MSCHNTKFQSAGFKKYIGLVIKRFYNWYKPQ